MTLQYFSNVANSPSTLPNILVDVVSSDHRVYNNNDSTSDSTSHAIACDGFTTLGNMVIGYFADIIIIDITARQKIVPLQKLGLTDKIRYMVPEKEGNQ